MRESRATVDDRSADLRVSFQWELCMRYYLVQHGLVAEYIAGFVSLRVWIDRKERVCLLGDIRGNLRLFTTSLQKSWGREESIERPSEYPAECAALQAPLPDPGQWFTGPGTCALNCFYNPHSMK